jgi:hypothetical protein
MYWRSKVDTHTHTQTLTHTHARARAHTHTTHTGLLCSSHAAAARPVEGAIYRECVLFTVLIIGASNRECVV